MDIKKQNRTELQTKLVVKFIKKLKVFRDLLGDDDQLFSQLASTIQLQDKSRGSEIIVEGEFGDTFYIILAGKVTVLKAQLLPIKEDKKLTKLEEGEL